MADNTSEILDTKSDTQSIDSGSNKMSKIFQNDDIQKAIDQIVRSDSIENPDFNAADYINQLFPTEQSLSTIDDVLIKMENECQQIDENIRSVVRSQTTTAHEGRFALSEAQNVIGHLFEQIIEIKTRAEKTEDMVKEITRDIKQLDWAKKNLTSAITTLNHLHILVGGIENLSILAENRQYGELLNPLQAIIEVNKHFQQYTQIPKIKDLSIKVKQIQEKLATQISADFRNTLMGSSTSSMHSSGNRLSLSQLADACSVVSVLEDQKVKTELLKWFISLQLQEYEQLFHENEDIAWITKIDKRYAWLKRHLLDFENRLGKVFPMDWEVSERITIQFCLLTRESLALLMQKRRTEIDVKLLLFAISKTQQFELLLAKRFNGLILASMNILAKASRPPKIIQLDDKAMAPADDISQIGNSPFIGLISICFEAFLDIYTDSVDRNLADIMERFVLDSSKSKVECDPMANNNSTVLPSCADLFVFYKKCLVQCTQLSNEKPMYQLTQIFKKYLREYAGKILEQKIPKASVHHATSLGTSMSMLTKDFQNLSAAAGNVLQNLLKEGDQPRYSRDEIVRLCGILTTAEYCVETVEQLEAKLKEKCDEAYADKIDLSDEKDIFHRCISNCIHLMVQDIEWGCEAALIVMNKTTWYNIQNVGDQSPFVNSIKSNFHATIPIIRDNLSASRKYYTQFCLKFVNSFIPRYINALYKCRLMNSSSVSDSNAYSNLNTSTSSQHTNNNSSSILGCEQLLLDTHSLKTILFDLPSIGSQVKRKAPASYSKVVVKGMTKAEMIIKIVMQPTTPPQTFIEQYLKLLPESSQTEFNKIMDMKGLKRSDSTYLVELYKRMVPKDSGHQMSTNPFENENDSGVGSTIGNILKSTTSGDGTIASSIKQTASSVTSSLTASADKGRIRKLENLIKKRLP